MTTRQMSQQSSDVPRSIAVTVDDDDGFEPDLCDGCRRQIPFGEPHLTGIESCCGGGCYRSLCRECVREAVRMFDQVDAEADKEAGDGND